MSENMKHAIVPITFLDDIEYNAENDKKQFMANLNELFVSPYNINTIYRPITTVEPTDRIVDAYNDSIKKSKIAYIQMNVEDLVVNSMYEIISDIIEPRTLTDTGRINEIGDFYKEKFINNLYIHDIIKSELENIEFIDITMCNLYTRITKDIIDPFVVMISSLIIGYPAICKNIYHKYVDDNNEEFDKIYHSYGNSLYCNISSIIRDIAEIKMSNIRRLFDVIKQTYLNMGQFASDYHIDPASKQIVSGNTSYYDYLMNEKFTTEEEN